MKYGIEVFVNTELRALIKDIIGKPCCRQQVGWMRSLSLGFGEKVQHKTPVGERIYGEWELGTYHGSWRVVQGGRILRGSQDAADTIEKLNLALARVQLGRFAALRQLTDLDVRVECDNGVYIDVLATASDSDECFHIFCPEKRHVEFSVGGGWKVGASDRPWEGRDFQGHP